MIFHDQTQRFLKNPIICAIPVLRLDLRCNILNFTFRTLFWLWPTWLWLIQLWPTALSPTRLWPTQLWRARLCPTTLANTNHGPKLFCFLLFAFLRTSLCSVRTHGFTWHVATLRAGRMLNQWKIYNLTLANLTWAVVNPASQRNRHNQTTLQKFWFRWGAGFAVISANVDTRCIVAPRFGIGVYLINIRSLNWKN